MITKLYDFDGAQSENAYDILASLIIPRPIALVTTCDAVGAVNAAPFSFFNILGVEPPIVALGIGDKGMDPPRTPPGTSWSQGSASFIWCIPIWGRR